MICKDIQNLIRYSINEGLIDAEDEIVIRNQLMDALHVYDWNEADAADAACLDSRHSSADDTASIDAILEPLINYACANGVIEDTTGNRDLFDTKLMGIVTPLPREINRDFRARYSKTAETATAWYYGISKKLNYVRAGRIAKDLKWTYESDYGTLDITINRSKPEKDPRDIAKAGAARSTAYPKCQLCAENMGFAGNDHHPARQNLRPIPISIDGGSWYLQYSPYSYYNEHCIVFNSRHIPMVIDESAFRKLFDFIGQFPHYFVGSNADLPIVGGSILSHEHFQGGHYTFAMEKASEEQEFALEGFPDVHAATVKWPMTVIRLRSADKAQLTAACTKVLAAWRSYSDEEAGVLAYTEGVPHNTITPIARMNGGLYECDLVLRNNITSEDRPLGVFHPNPSLHHIKKENIGLIEVMGLAVLPARLANELEAVREVLLSGGNLRENPQTASHAEWAEALKAAHPEMNEENAMDIIHAEVGAVFEEVLHDAGVFKRDEAGKAAFMRFIDSLNGKAVK